MNDSNMLSYFGAGNDMIFLPFYHTRNSNGFLSILVSKIIIQTQVNKILDGLILYALKR